MDDVSGCCSDLADLAQRVEIIVSGEITDCNGTLSDDKREIWNDYTISIEEIYKQGRKSTFAPGAKIQVTDVGSPPIPQGTPEVFFIGTCDRSDCSTPYRFAGPGGFFGAISLENGQVTCSARPHPVWKPYCGITASSFISTLKQKVAYGDFIYKYYTWTTLQGTLIERKVKWCVRGWGDAR